MLELTQFTVGGSGQRLHTSDPSHLPLPLLRMSCCGLDVVRSPRVSVLGAWLLKWNMGDGGSFKK